MRTIADFVMQALRLTGTDVVFGYPGQSNLGLLHAARRAGLRYVQAADERGAGFAAIGYALSTQKVGIWRLPGRRPQPADAMLGAMKTACRWWS
jgi:thiamine pyrophosphate-dependent acetolactate synthase large subunit-like protein